MSTSLALVLVVVFLAGNAFFVGAEFAVISARRSAIEPLAAAGDRRARTPRPDVARVPRFCDAPITVAACPWSRNHNGLSVARPTPSGHPSSRIVRARRNTP